MNSQLSRLLGHILTVSVLGLVLSACGGGGGGGSNTNTPAPDTASPQLVGLSPASLATNVPINASISATFSEEMNAATISSSSFYLNGVSGSVTYDASSRIAVLTPDSPLPYATDITAIVTTDVTDLAGNALPLLHSWTFTTESDSVAPVIITRSPAAGEIGVPLNSNIEVQFSESINPTTLDASSFYLSLNGWRVSATVSYDDVTHTAMLTPANPLNYQGSYTVTLTRSITDLAGNSLAADEQWSFDAELELTPPNVTSTLPTDLSTGVDRNALVQIYFDEPLATSTVVPANFLINNIPASSVSLINGGKTVRVAHNPFDYSSNQVVTVTTGVTDLYNNSLSAPYSFSFDVLADVIPPTVSSWAPIDGSRMIARDYQDIRAKFSEAMDPSTLTSNTVTVKNSTGTVTVSGTVSYDATLNEVSFTPSGLLPVATDLVFEVSAQVTDESGNGLATPFSVGFRTVSQHERLNDLTAGHATKPVMSFDSTSMGNGIAVWSQETGTNGVEVVWSAYTVTKWGAGWSPEQVLHTDYNSFNSGIRIVNNGTSHAVTWTSSEGIHAAVYKQGLGWGTVTLLATAGSVTHQVTDGVDFAVAWQEWSYPYHFVSVYNSASATWSSAESPLGWASYETETVLTSRGETGLGGDFMLLNSTSQNIYSSRYLPESQSWGPVETVFSVTEGSLTGIQIAGNNLDYMVSFVHSTTLADPTPHTLYTRRYSGTSWQGKQKLAEFASSPLGLLLASNGLWVRTTPKFLLTYSTGTDLRARVFDNGLWGVELDPTGSVSSTLVTGIASDGDGFLVTWNAADQQSLDGASVYASGSWGNPVLYNAVNANSVDKGAVAEGNSSGYALMWRQGVSGTNGGNIMTRSYSAGWGAETVVGTYGNSLTYLRVTRRKGTFGAIWRSGSGTGINASLSGLTHVWSAPAELVQSLHAAGVKHPDIIHVGNQSVAVWLQNQDGRTHPWLYTNRFSGGIWNGAELMASRTVNDFKIVSGGNSVLLLYRPSSSALYARVLDTTTGIWDPEFLVAQTDTWVNYDVDYNGSEFMIVWTHNNSLQASRFSVFGLSTPEIIIAGSSTSPALGAQVEASGSEFRVFAQIGESLSTRYYSSTQNAWDALATVGTGSSSDPTFWGYRAKSNDNGWLVTWKSPDGAQYRAFENGGWGAQASVSYSSTPHLITDGVDYLLGYSTGVSGNFYLWNRSGSTWNSQMAYTNPISFSLGGGGGGYGILTINNTTSGQRLGAFNLVNGSLGTRSFIDDGFDRPVLESAISSTPLTSDYSIVWTQAETGQGPGPQLWGATGM